MHKLRWIKRQWQSFLWVGFIKILVSPVCCILLFHLGNDEESFFIILKLEAVMSFITVSSGILKMVIWDDLDISGLDIWRSWVTKYHNGIFPMYISCHSRNGVYLQCHCQIKPKTGGRCNDAEPRASLIPFSSKAHNIGFCCEGYLKSAFLWVSVIPFRRESRNFLRQAGVCHWKFSCAWLTGAPFPE